MTHRPYLERAAHVLVAVALAFGLLVSAPLVQLAVADASAARVPGGLPLTRVPEGDVIARLLVPRLAIDLPVLEGIGSRTLAQGPGHLPGTPLPGEEAGSNHSVIAFARDGSSGLIVDLRVGDRVQMRTPFGLKTYRVCQRRVLAPERIPVGATRKPRVTFLTAYPADAVGPAPMRLALVLEPSTEVGMENRIARRAADLCAALCGPSGGLSPREP